VALVLRHSATAASGGSNRAVPPLTLTPLLVASSHCGSVNKIYVSCATTAAEFTGATATSGPKLRAAVCFT
jgi:hypothetical protein